jgi:hypothetical protein
MQFGQLKNECFRDFARNLNSWESLDEDFENRARQKRRKVIQDYLQDFSRFNSESLYPWGDLTSLVESFI